MIDDCRYSISRPATSPPRKQGSMAGRGDCRLRGNEVFIQREGNR